MCGIAGVIAANPECLDAMARAQSDALAHRGPNGVGLWRDGNFGFVHRRLAVLDLSPAGDQPMVSHCGRYTIIFNGEIYNWQEIRAELETCGQAPAWRGHSDTEVLLAGISAWGLKETLSRSRGMFAFALWDQRERALILARDRIGEKPLYYGKFEGGFFFGSELKALRAISQEGAAVSPQALALFLRYGYVPAPYSIYKDIHKLPPGTYLRVSGAGEYSKPEKWWNFQDVALSGSRNRSAANDKATIDALDNVLGDSVKEQMLADVPLGALLSGGIDSSVIVALMQRQSSSPVRTFTIGFSESEYDESVHAKAVARHLGTDHTELYVTPGEAMDVIPRLPDIYDEPFADSSQIPTFIVCSLARKNVTVCLSGDAGDELFGGYNRYFWGASIWKYFKPVPRSVRRIMSSGISHVSAETWNKVFGVAGGILPSRMRVSNPGDKLHKLADIMGARGPEELYGHLISQWRGILPLHDALEPKAFINSPDMWPPLDAFSERMMAVDTLTYLPDDILVKVDRAAMATSLETRVPFLDERVIDFSWKLPLDQKIRDGEGKWALRQLLYKYVPKELVDRPKQGFGVPLDHWLRGPLRDWAEDLLSVSSLSEDGFLEPLAIRSMWDRHLSGQNMQYALWNVLMYQAWKRRWC